MILDISPIWTYPPAAGGQSRIYNLNKNISNYFVVKQFSFRPPYANIKRRKVLESAILNITDSYTEYQIFNPFILGGSYLLSKCTLPPDMFFSHIAPLIKNKHLKKTLAKADIIQVERPWCFDYVYKRAPDTPIIYTALDCETLLAKKRMANFSNRFIAKVKQIEKKTIELADIVLAVSQEDVDNWKKVLSIKRENNVFLVPNGIDIEKCERPSDVEKKAKKALLGFSGKKIVIFVGGDHFPNVQAVEVIKELAKKFNNNYLFLIAGSVGRGFPNSRNIFFTGYKRDLTQYFKSADIAINPLQFGTGSSVKMLEYFAYGLPVISTKIGARGLEVVNKKHVIIDDIKNFDYWIRELFNNKNIYEELSKNSRCLVEEKYDWKNISSKVIDIYKKII